MAEVTPIHTTSAPGQDRPSRFGGAAPQRRKREKAASDYKKSLKEKQALKQMYGLSERQFKRYVMEALERMQKVDNVSDELVRRLERRLDNVVFRMGIAKSRPHARQLVSHAYFLVNGRPVNIPSFQVEKGTKVQLKANKQKKPMIETLSQEMKKHAAPSWIRLAKDVVAAEVVGDPSMAEANPPVEISLIFEFYSR
ncbi:MAG: 30S ribosomal protein S4 [Candidatus Saccharimonadales bacterium]